MLETKRCIITDLEASDEDHIVELMTNEDVRRYLGGTKDEAAVRAHFASLVECGFAPQEWVIRTKDSRKFIGLISLHPHHDGEDTELSYELLPEWWRRGYAKEATQAVINYGLTVLGLPRVIAETQSANTPSRRLLESLGMKVERTVERFDAEQSIYVTVQNPETKELS